MWKNLLYLLAIVLPWRLRRRLLATFLGYQIHPTSHIGFAWVRPRKLVMGPYSSIGHLTFCWKLDSVQLGQHAIIGRGNWITGYPSQDSGHFAGQSRSPELVVGDHAAITHRHLIDCTDRVSVGPYATVAGWGTQILTHSINLETCKQTAGAVSVGSFSFVGTSSVLLPGCALPDYSILGARSVLTSKKSDPYGLYAGVPATHVKQLPKHYLYFSRTMGPVD